MEYYEREFFIARIDAGYLRCSTENGTILIHPPHKDILYQAQEIYHDAYQCAMLEGLMDDEEILDFMVREKLWTKENQHDLDILPENIEKLKVSLYRNCYKVRLQERARQTLEISKKEYERLTALRHAWDYITCHGLATFTRWQFIILNSVTYEDGRPYDWADMDTLQVLNFFNQSVLADTMIRQLARTDPWVGIWPIRKKAGQLFQEPMTIEQSRLLMWSIMYDNIQEASEPPHESVIDDDDMLDGWLILKRKEREKDQRKAAGEAQIAENPKIANADEVFLVADNMKSAKEIYDMNDEYGRRVINQRAAFAKKKGTARLMDLPDMRQRLQMEATKKLGQTMKGINNG